MINGLKSYEVLDITGKDCFYGKKYNKKGRQK